MQKRLSMVNEIKINTTGSSSVVQIGDSVKFAPRTKALAVQKEYPIFEGTEGDFDQFEVYTQKIPKVPFGCPVHMTTYNEVPIIKADHIRIFGIAASSMLQIGSIGFVDSESRVEHFRHFFNPPEET